MSHYKGILMSQLIRIRRISSCRTDYDEASEVVFASLGGQGYSHWYMRHMKSVILKLTTVDRLRRHGDNDRILACVVSCLDVGTRLARLLHNITEINELFLNIRIINAHTFDRNLVWTLVSSTFRSTVEWYVRQPLHVIHLPDDCFRRSNNHSCACD